MIKVINQAMIQNVNDLKSKFEFDKSLMSKSNMSKSMMTDKTPSKMQHLNPPEMSPFQMVN